MKKSVLVWCVSIASAATIGWVAPVASMKTHSKADVDRNRFGGSIALHAAGGGNPWISLRDGRDVPTFYSGPLALRQVLERGLVQPTALASGDFDEDGVPDLIGAYVGAGRGIVTLHRGNVDSIYPNSSEAERRRALGAFTNAPFLPEAWSFEVPIAPDFLGVGDFDADGHWDVVAATRGGDRLYFLRGDGTGHFSGSAEVRLPGKATAMAIGEINRADGLSDIVLGISATDGPKVAVYEAPEGALNGRPEFFAMPAEPVALALGQLDDGYPVDLAVAAGNELVIVHGRDRKLSLDAIRRAQVPAAAVERLSLPFNMNSVAIGDFIGDAEHRPDLAVLSSAGVVHFLQYLAPNARNRNEGGAWELKKSVQAVASNITTATVPSATALIPAKVSTTPVDDLIVVDRASRKLQVLTGDARESKAIGPSTRMLKEYQIAAFLSTEGEPVAVLPMRLNGDAFSDLAVLRNGQTLPSVVPSSSSMTFTVTNVNDEGPGSLRQAILDANANPGLDTITFSIGSGHQFINIGRTLGYGLPRIEDPVTIDGTTQPGYAGTPLIEVDGTFSLCCGTDNSNNGLNLAGPGLSTIRGLAINDFSVGNGIWISAGTGNIVEGNCIGTRYDCAFSADDYANYGDGIGIDFSSNNRIGGTVAAARNVISGNRGRGIAIGSNGGTGNCGNVVEGNFIGTDGNGATAVGNLQSGVFGGTNCGNTNIYGGTVAGARNLISGNGGSGIQLVNGLVQGNYIGTDVNGTAALGNALYGVFIYSGGLGITVGGTVAAARNVISGNKSGGVADIEYPEGSQVQGNYIGTNVAGTVALANAGDGVLINAFRTITIGGTAPGARNLISGNTRFGIEIAGAAGNIAQGNYIGTAANGAAVLGNSAGGVYIGQGPTSTANELGGTDAGAGNLIAGNTAGGGFGGHGVLISGGVASVLSNSIFSNAGLGIAFSNNGPTPNDSCDGDTGPNNLQNYPLLTSVSTTSIQGNLNSTANTTFLIQFFANAAGDPSGYGEGQSFVGSMNVTTDGNCNASFNFAASLSAGQAITATATGPVYGTSEFSQWIAVSAGSATHFTVSAPASATAGTAFSFTVTALDASNLTATGYTGTVQFTSSDGQAVLPANSTLTNGVGTFSATLKTAGSQTVTATDTVTASITGTSAAITVSAIADLSVTKTDSPDPVIRGDNITYTVTVTNNGPSVASNVSLSDPLPSDTPFVSNSGATGWSCVNPSTKGNATGTITCTKATLASGESATFTIVVAVKHGAKEGTIITNTATVSSSISDPNTGNNSAAAATTVIRK